VVLDGSWAVFGKKDPEARCKKLFLGAIGVSFLFSYSVLSLGGYGGFTVHH